jgi:hypothetical protein
MAKRRRKSNNPEGRPSTGLTETKVLLTGPAELIAAGRAAAEREGISYAEWVRRAMRAALATDHGTDR